MSPLTITPPPKPRTPWKQGEERPEPKHAPEPGYRSWVQHYVVQKYGELLGGEAIALYTNIVCHASAETGEAWPSYQTLARQTRWCVNTVKKYARVLKQHRIMDIETRTFSNGVKRWEGPFFTLLDPPLLPKVAEEMPAPPPEPSLPQEDLTPEVPSPVVPSPRLRRLAPLLPLRTVSPRGRQTTCLFHHTPLRHGCQILINIRL